MLQRHGGHDRRHGGLGGVGVPNLATFVEYVGFTCVGLDIE